MALACKTSMPSVLACAERYASISTPYRLAGAPSTSALKAAPSPTHRSTAENSDEKLRCLLSRFASATGKGKKPNLVFPLTCTAYLSWLKGVLLERIAKLTLNRKSVGRKD